VRVRTPLLSLALSLLAVAVLVPVPSSEAQQFTRTERRTLEEGQPVRHPRSQNRSGHAFVGGNAWRVIPRPLDEVWRSLNDSAHLCQMLPQCVGQRVVVAGSDRRVMRFTHEYGPIRASYHMRMDLDQASHDLSFRLDRSRPNDVREAWGFLNVRRYRGSDARTLVSWGVMADPGSQIMTTLLGGAVQASLLRVPDELHDYMVVGPGRNRYR